MDSFDFEQFINDNSSNYTKTILCKVFSQIIGLCLLLRWFFYAPGLWWIIITVGAIASVAIDFVFSRRYAGYVNAAIKSIKNVSVLNKTPQSDAPWDALLDFPYSGLITQKEDELIVQSDETKVISQELNFANKVSKNDIETLFTCEYYFADMEGRTTFANNMILVKGKLPFVKRLKFRHEISQYVLCYDNLLDLDECNIPRVCAIADKVAAYVGDKDFAMFFSPKNIHLVLPILNMDKFNYDIFDYKIEKRIRRDVAAVANRACLSDFLAEN